MSYIISSINKTTSLQKAFLMCNEMNIHSIDITNIVKKDETKSIGVKDIKEMMQKIYLKPLKSQQKSVIIEDAELLTPEAQNALLKILEEPPANTIIFLLSTTKEVFLPTILSRCRLIEIKDNEDILLNGENTYPWLSSHSSLTPALGLELAEKLSKNKEDASLELKRMILSCRQALTKSIMSGDKRQLQYAHILKMLHKTHKNLTNTNINTRLEFEHLFLSLSTD